ncbi:hypothetical protein, partial [Paenibacillus germinis]|uniref:hypothetical protein n=1 Tax=Paenibacillus germinis TaxID=2654979 RepID=UPI001C117553
PSSLAESAILVLIHLRSFYSLSCKLRNQPLSFQVPSSPRLSLILSSLSYPISVTTSRKLRFGAYSPSLPIFFSLYFESQ